ncbi:MAG: hypothetical protein EYC70_16260 [Planctomycetota bacterium]|nr:MAG: hypothetical protein EYC70_16260 [Planctomycetota bacterium]
MLRVLRTLTASLVLATAAWPQSASNDSFSDPRAGAEPLTQFALGSVVAGPFDVENGPPTANIRMLGVEYAFGRYFVTGGAPNAASPKYIYWFDTNGVYQGEVTQYNSMASNWGGRDGEADEANNKLYFGEEVGRIAEYTWNGSTLTNTNVYTITGAGTVRALARNPNTGRFYKCDFSLSIFEFDLNGTIHATYANPGAAFYGFAWDPCSNTLWGWSQSGTPAVRADELDPTTMTFTGRTFTGVAGVGTPIAGGCDIYVDPRNPGFLSMVALHQIDPTPDSLYVYDLAVPECGGPSFHLQVVGTCGGAMNFQVSGATPGGTVRLVYSSSTGSFTIPAGSPCAGTQLGLDRPINLAPITINIGPGGNGQSGSVNVPVGACGVVNVQALDLGSCTASNVILLR